jgi:hypothetical protein
MSAQAGSAIASVHSARTPAALLERGRAELLDAHAAGGEARHERVDLGFVARAAT